MMSSISTPDALILILALVGAGFLWVTFLDLFYAIACVVGRWILFPERLGKGR